MVSEGQIFNDWTALRKADRSGYWHAQCSCGTKQLVQGAKLAAGVTKGCSKCKEARYIRYKKGMRIGFLTVVGDSKMMSGARNGKPVMHGLCVCDCGTEVWIRKDHISARSLRKSCGCKRFGNNSYAWKGYKGISGEKFGQIRKGAESRNIDFKISIESIWDLYEEQNHKCVLTGWDLEMGLGCTASLDRIDSSKCYTIDNVQWVHKDVNIAKNAMVEKDFINLCAAVATHSRYR